ncbi:MAG: response regulator [Cyanobacteria bacterium J06638_20]
MQSEQQRRIMGYFIEEARDHLNTIEQGLLKLQATISDPDMANEVFRAAHSVKGGAAMLGLGSIQHTAHRLEDYFKVLKECPVQVDRRLENLLLNVFDTLRDLLDQLQGPFGLTDDKAEEAMGVVEPVFAQLNQHIEHLVTQAGGTTPDDVDLSTPAAVTAPATSATPQTVGAAATEESAFQLIFQSDVPARLREMLNLFKQPEGIEPRRQLQEICQSLGQAGEQFDLVPWVDLLALARRAIAHPDNMFRTLAPVIIREIKSAQELVLVSQSLSIAPGDALLALVPPEAEDEEDVLESLDLFADDEGEMGTLDLAGMDSDAFLMNMPELDLEADGAAKDVAASGSAIPIDGALVQDLAFEGIEDLSDSRDRGGEGSPSNEASPGMETERNGPAVGSAELNSLADLFETQSSPELSMNWDGEEVLPNADEEIPELLNSNSGDDFSDLLQQGGLEDLLGAEVEEDENLSDLLHQAEQSERRVKQQEASLDALLGKTSSDNFLSELSDLSLEANDPLSNPTPESATPSSADSETFDSLFDGSSEDDPSASDPFGDLELGGTSSESSVPFLDAAEHDEQPTALESAASDADLGGLGLIFGEEAGESSDGLELDLELETAAESLSDAEINSDATNTEDSLFDLSNLDLPDLSESEVDALDTNSGVSAFGNLADDEATEADTIPEISDEGDEDLSWLNALDSEEGLEDLPVAPAVWDDQAVDVTSDLWADATATVDALGDETLAASEEVPFHVADSSQATEQPEPMIEGLDLSLSEEDNTNAILAGLAQEGDLTSLSAEAQPSVENLEAANDLDIEELAAIASDEISESLLGETATSDLDLDLDALSEEPANRSNDSSDDMFGTTDAAENGAEVDLDFDTLLNTSAPGIEEDASLFLEEADAEAALPQLENLSEGEADANVVDFDGLMGDAEASLFPSESVTNASSNTDLGSEFDALLGEFGDTSEGMTDAAVIPSPATNADGIDPDNFADLDALLSEATDLTDATEGDWSDLDLESAVLDAPQGDSSASSTASQAMDGGTEGDEGFDALESLLDEPATPPGGNAGSEGNDFSDLEALLASDSIPPNPATPPPPPSSPPIEDEFDELEELLQAADSSMGGSPTVKGARSQSMTNRPTRTSGLRSDQTMRVSVKNLDNLNNLIGELVVNRNSLEQAEERLRQFLDNLQYQVQQLSDVGQRMRDLYERSLLESSLMSSRRSYQMAGRQGNIQESDHATGASFDALEMDRFTGFHTLSQEMIELIVRVRESASDIDFVVGETDQVTRNFRQITSQLQESLTRARMVPFAQTADRLPRAVRDISMRCGKQAELVIEGRETLIDKMILEQLYDPMTHLVNNAITHGIETAEARVTQGKQPTGQITVRAFHQGNQTVISVSDDGAGIDPDIVKQKAIERGLVTQDQANVMNRLDVYDLLFHHGFSTRDRADDFAGRGVGMDVVRTSLNDIRGVVNIDSTIGRGTTFTVRLPLTLSVSKALCCISTRARIAFPMDGVEDMLDVPADQVQTNGEGQTCIQWRDQLLPFQALEDLLQFNRSLGRGSVYGGNQEEDIISVVVLRSNAGSYLALKVDQVLGEQEIVIKQLEGPVPKPVGIAGATVLGDGRIMPIADVLELIDLSMGRIRRESGTPLWEQAQEQIPVEPPSDTKSEPTVLIVDDSITVRELLSMTFNKVGYRVEQARDGQEAWEKLRSGLPCDLVFCDIEMPRMDGLELLSRIQKDSGLSNIPIAMLTSRGADRHRQMAIQLGAKGYFTKPYLEEVLLDAAQRMLTGEVLVDENGG